MKVSEQWLREWVNPGLGPQALCDKLIMAGLEVEERAPVAEPFSNVVVAEVTSVEKHPEADRLKVCQVNIGDPDQGPVTIVCGATNVRPGIKVPAALVGAKLPNNVKISRSKIRNVVSNGMLCSPTELGLLIEGNGLYELPLDAPVGQNFWDYFNLSDHVLDLSITPNRGDCLSVMGLAKEIAALTEVAVTFPYEIKSMKPSITDVLPVVVEVPNECPRYVGRIIRQVQADAATPIWLQERLRRSGIRCISPVVDVMNYVMLELGQPMHAFDLQEIVDEIKVRKALADETLTLLDGQTVTLNETVLVIADAKKPLAIAGVMGGLDSGVTLLTQDIFLESAFFVPGTVARAARHYGFGSESSYRFERGIDPTLQAKAIERATDLLLAIVGGKPGPIIDVSYDLYLHKPVKINLRAERVQKIIGMTIAPHEIAAILQRLEFSPEKTAEGWSVTVPPRRTDITKEIDLIEEIIRLHGYAHLPVHAPKATLQVPVMQPGAVNRISLHHACRDLGYQEVITYSFIDKKIQKLFDPDHTPKELLNPITNDMAVMRTSLWPGLVNALVYNLNRQQHRVRLFEMGARFIPQGTEHYLQQSVMGGLVNGLALPEQWGSPSRPVDFFDLKNDIETVLKLPGWNVSYEFKKSTHPALHPGQRADIYRENEYLGTFGLLHPVILQTLDLRGPVFLFEILLAPLENTTLPKATEISKFPELRRDIAIFVDQAVPVQDIQDTILEVGGEWLRNVKLFDVYQGKSGTDRKSIALALTLQHSSRTLVDTEVADIVERVIVALKQRFAAELRG